MGEAERRFVFSGRLNLISALHIGGGSVGFAPTEHPILRTASGIPVIPGSSLKGAFRSAVEGLAILIADVRSCALDPSYACVGPQGRRQKAFNDTAEKEDWTPEELLSNLDGRLCDTCWLFGSPYAASHIEFSDLLPAGEGQPPSSVRDGVAIDRDTGRAADRRKFDYEVLEPGVSFPFEITLTCRRKFDLGLACLGIMELQAGRIRLGGLASRGLGRVKLDELRVFEFDLSDPKAAPQRLKELLLARAAPPDQGIPSSALGFREIPQSDEFVTQALKGLVAGG
jgi:CRISPR-associated protein Csm3